MLAAKPIIKSVDEPDSEVERTKCGIQVEAENVEQVRDAILKLAAMSPEDRATMGNNGRRYAIENLEYHTLSEKFIDYVMHTKD